MNASDALASKLAPYRERPGVKGALLISHDGFLVAAAADADVDTEAVAAHLGGAIDIAARLADELAQRETRLITVELDQLNIVLAPFSDELLLCLIGTPEAISLEYRLRGGRA
jgi:predicted regulator of Ras-like GTPase activity (Roadblock/LC7/MglB family)